MNMRPIWAAVRTRRIANHPQRSPQQAASIWYERMTRAVARKGWRKLPEQTPDEFLITINDPQLQQLVAAFTDRYRQARFAESADDARQLPELYQEVAGKKK
jgi:sarcosine oxidase gamma subunit